MLPKTTKNAKNHDCLKNWARFTEHFLVWIRQESHIAKGRRKLVESNPTKY